MMVKVLRTFMSLFLVSSTADSASIFFFQPPILDIEELSRDINASTTLEINCIGKHPVFWKLPDRNIAANDTRLSIVNSIEYETSGKLHKTQLLLRNVSYTDTGYYSCYYDGTTDFSFRDNATSVYIFVNDDDNLFVERFSVLKGHMLVLLQHNRKAVIACLPTSSDANVTLWKKEDESEEGTPVALGADILFDPTQGFILFYPTIFFSGTFQCRATRNHRNQHIELNIIYMPDTLFEPVPIIDYSQATHPVIHGNFTLKCIVNVDPTALVYFSWIYPNKNSSRVNETAAHSIMRNTRGHTHQEVISYLMVRDALPSDSGTYKCLVTDHAEKTGRAEVKIFVYAAQQPTHVNFTTDLDIEQPVISQVGKDVQFVISVHAYPSTTDVVLYWLKNGELYSADPQLKRSGNSVKLEISNLSRDDAGVYTMVGKTSDTVNNISIELVVEDKPMVMVEQVSTYYLLGRRTTLQCKAESLPTPIVWWRWKPCQSVESCDPDVPYGWQDVEDNSVYPNEDKANMKIFGVRNHSAVAYLNVTARKSGHYMCAASNVMGQDEAIIPFIVTDAKGGFEIKMSDDRPIEGDNLTLTCLANTFYFSGVHWEWSLANGRNLEDSRVTLHTFVTEYSHSATIFFQPVNLVDSGIYKCVGTRRAGNDSIASVVGIRVQKIELPSFNETNMMGGVISTTPGTYREFYCYVQGVPEPTITWMKDGSVFDVTNMSGVELDEDDHKLILKRVLEKDSGLYECLAKNRGGTIVASTTLNVLFDEVPRTDQGVMIAIAAVAAIVTIVVFLTVIFLQRMKKKQEEKKELDFLNQSMFEPSYVDIFNPSLPLQDQVDLLPYKHQWEFPKERLKLGKTLGQGAFGRVVKAEAIGIIQKEVSTVVAVKMLKETANTEQRKALIAELKILIHVGRHVNILNLMGAVTKNLTKGELMVIVEYCCYGNLRHFLLKHKRSFVDQLDPDTGLLNTHALSSQGSPYLTAAKRNVVQYANMFGLGVDNPSYRPQILNYADLSHRNSDSRGSNVPETSGRGVLSPTAEEPEDENLCLTTHNLLSFAFQCARGMEYLASQKFIHRDVAARNILLAKDYVIKICDFGLAKDCNKYSNYIKRTDGLLPIKWMAIESIADRVFTSKSDVWSFGILLWEMFTLGGNPYPGIQINDEFFKRLKNGYRMEKPDHAPINIYQIMKDCWVSDPKMRPDFGQLTERIGTLLEAGVRKYYMELNEPYQLMNGQNNNDYLQMEDSLCVVEYAKMQDARTFETYDSVGSMMRPVGNGPVPRVPMEAVPMIRLDSLCWSEQQVRRSVPFRSFSLENVSKTNFLDTTGEVDAFRTDDEDDDNDSVFLDDSKLPPVYMNGYVRRMEDLDSQETSTKC